MLGKNDNSLEDLLTCSAPSALDFPQYRKCIFAFLSCPASVCWGRERLHHNLILQVTQHPLLCVFPPAFLSIAKSFMVSNNLPLCVVHVHIYPYTQFLHKSTYMHLSVLICSVQFNQSVVSDYLQAHGLQHTRLPCPSPTPGACSNSVCISDAIQPSHPLSTPSPTFNLSQHQGLFP